MASWSPQQDHALTSVAEWLASPSGKQVFRLFGYAGTGKTTLARHFAENVKGDVVFGAYTGKAALVLRSKGCKGASTLHSLLYVPERGTAAHPASFSTETAPCDLPRSSSWTRSRWSTRRSAAICFPSDGRSSSWAILHKCLP